ncbi:hypothetical protein RFM41_04275 [Mesorhizobium sp. VK25A]|uniref:Gfo/Idh/MocA family oxidoreductase n=1 Tax=Mesorhizobium vachelliae TaxID=3072309 RepID=A0ABU5A216_9HYPH|nr:MULTISPECIES: hypothetical protein [unclassified Mesorhizobium]MDX8531310.1 hypothetical protein [Mesorhizobium sp. VK25D]MDX8542939.1 hypothetical protein [Mesorhizobium sp. VK25A]
MKKLKVAVLGTGMIVRRALPRVDSALAVHESIDPVYRQSGMG